MKPAAFLFDLDGTLVDTEAVWTRAMVDFIASRGAQTTFDELLPLVVGRNWFDIDATLHEKFPVLGDSTPMEDAALLREFYNRHVGDSSTMRIEGSIAFLKKVAALAPCVIVSGSPHDDIVAATEICGITDCLSFVLGAGEYEDGKPSPSGYLKAAKLLGVDPAKCVVIEDSTVGVQAGVAAGMRVIALDRGVSGVPQCYDGAMWRVKDLVEFDIAEAFA